MHELSAAISTHWAEVLCKYKGGVSFFVPKIARPDHEIAKIIGYGPMSHLCSIYGGEYITIPVSGVQKEKILKLIAEGKTKASIAQECGVSERYVYLLSSLGVDAPKPLNSRQLTLLQ